MHYETNQLSAQQERLPTKFMYESLIMLKQQGFHNLFKIGTKQ